MHLIRTINTKFWSTIPQQSTLFVFSSSYIYTRKLFQELNTGEILRLCRKFSRGNSLTEIILNSNIKRLHMLSSKGTCPQITVYLLVDDSSNFPWPWIFDCQWAKVVNSSMVTFPFTFLLWIQRRLKCLYSSFEKEKLQVIFVF